MRFFKRNPKPYEAANQADTTEAPTPRAIERAASADSERHLPIAEDQAKEAPKPKLEPPKFQEMERLPRGVEPIKSRKWTAEEVDTALLCLAVHGGRSQKAQDELAGRGIEVSQQTLCEWKLHNYPERYRYIQEHHAHQLEDVLVQNQREVAVSATAAALDAIDRVHDTISLVEPKDLPKAAQALQTTAGIATDKVLTLTGRPTQVTEHRSADQVLAKYGGHVIDGEAEELPATPELPQR